MRLGCFGLAMVVTKALRLEKDMQTKENHMERLGHVDMFVQTRVIDCKIKKIIPQNVQELKLKMIVKFAWVLQQLEVLMKILPLRRTIKLPVILQTKPVHEIVSSSILCDHALKILDLINIKSLPK